MRRKAVAVAALVVLVVAAPITAWSVVWEKTISSARCTVTEVVDIHTRYTPKFEVETVTPVFARPAGGGRPRLEG